MSNELATIGGNSVLAIQDDQSYWNDSQITALRQLGVKDATPADLGVFFHQVTKTGLDPFAKQIYMIGRWSKEGTKQTIQTGIDGFRLIARRAADRSGETVEYEDSQWCGEDGVWRDVWISKQPPAAARVVVLRNGRRFPAVAAYSEYVQTIKGGAPNSMWAGMPANQLAKCAEALALRKAFPQDLSGIYTDDEMGPADRAPAEPAASSAIDKLRAAAEPEPEPTSDFADLGERPDIPADVKANVEKAKQDGNLPAYLDYLIEREAPNHILNYVKEQA